ncbi:MAG: SDR family NAD(P)-dependent oxidoreductase [Candidatus Peribacteraceae bacterium]|nr:SDR family NAD(P)-dependent oxidoreductase [Candidatus Peribacteraceae bacterium]
MQKRVALVTAGSRGLGAEIVRTLAKAGNDVAFTYLSEKEAAESLVKEVEALGGKSIAIQANAADFSRAKEIVQTIEKQLGGLHALVCSAGIARKGTLWELSEEDWDEVIDVTLKGTFNYIHAVSPVFIQQKAGKIVSIGSINGLRARRGTASYNAAKAGLTGLIKAAALELGEYNINVNVVAPGFIETTSQVDTPDSVRELVLSECAIKRLGQPEDIAPVVAFLCSEEARHITGQVLKVDAGQYI